jgi:hypothetical protein
MLFVVYIAIGTAHLRHINDPRMLGELHIVAGFAHLAD